MADEVQHEQRKQRVSGSSIYVASVIAVFIVGLLIAIGWYLYQQHQQQRAVEERQQRNEELGLSRDFPSDRVPVYPGLELVESERGTATATTGEPMYKWVVHWQIDADKDALYEYYHQYFMEAGMRQTQYVSIPTGYGIDYADETMSLEMVIEYRQGSELLQVEVTIYLLR